MQRNEVLGILFATTVLLFLSYYPIVQNFRATPADRYYYGQSEYPLDMLGDLSYVQQGYGGNLLASINYSTMIGGNPSVVRMEYTLIGLVGRILNISPAKMFFASRVVISFCILGVIYFLIRRTFTKMWQRMVSYLFVLFGAGITIPGVRNTFDGYDVQVFPRLTQAMPHYLLGAGAILLTLYFLSQVLEKPKRTAVFVLSLVFGIAASFLYTPNGVLLISGFPLYIVLDTVSAYIRTKHFRVDPVKVGILFSFSVLMFASMTFVRYASVIVRSDIRSAFMESLYPFHVSGVGYIMAVGIVYLLSFIAVGRVVKSGKPLTLLILTWLFMHPVGVFILSPLLHINNIRFFLTPYYVAFGVLGTIGITVLADLMHKLLRNIPHWVLATALVAAVLLTSMGTYAGVWRGEHLCFCIDKFFDYAYPKKTVMDGIFWLRGNTRSGDIILSSYYAGTLISAFAGNRPYVTWWYRLIEPPTFQHTDSNLALFYSGTISEPDAYAFLTHEHIAYVFYSESEQAYFGGKQSLQYSFLKERFNRNGTHIYQVQSL